MHLLSPVGAEVMTRRFEEMDKEGIQEEDRFTMLNIMTCRLCSFINSVSQRAIWTPMFEKGDENKSSNSSFFSSRRVFTLCLFFRMANSLLVQTYFNPDEHWQALEVAHYITFGYGHLTWEWKRQLRSYLHPLIFALFYKILAVLKLDTPSFMIRGPRLLQSVFCACGDLYLYKLSCHLFNYQVARWALFSQLTNWFMFFSFTRTLSNSLETVLVIVGLYYWPCMRISSRREVSRKWALFIALLSCAIRPTGAVIWVYVCLLELLETADKLKFILCDAVPIGFGGLGLACAVDRLMYGSWVLVPINFLNFNFISSGGDYYGTHKWHWYFSQGFVVMVFTFIPFTISGIIMAKCWRSFGLMAWVLLFYSLLGHKEFRFVLPVLPIAFIFSGYTLAEMDSNLNPSKAKGLKRNHSLCFSGNRLAVYFLLATNIPMALYMCLVHQRGAEDVMNYLAHEAYSGKVGSILFLMPCHSTPYYSTLHQNVPMRFLDCSPREDGMDMDESDRFLIDPTGFMTEFAKHWCRPSHIVLFESEEMKLMDLLLSHSFVEERRFFHSHFKVDRELQASVVVYASINIPQI